MKITLGQLIGIVVLVVVVGVGAYIGTSKLKKSDSNVAGGKTRQAVFLDNGQVYFGFISQEESKTVKLKDIYYLQTSTQTGDKAKDQNANLSLVKLGNELHGPVDEMRINRDHILFVEDMKDESQVNKAIADFIKNGSPSPTPTPAS